MGVLGFPCAGIGGAGGIAWPTVDERNRLRAVVEQGLRYPSKPSPFSGWTARGRCENRGRKFGGGMAPTLSLLALNQPSGNSGCPWLSGGCPGLRCWASGLRASCCLFQKGFWIFSIRTPLCPQPAIRTTPGPRRSELYLATNESSIPA